MGGARGDSPSARSVVVISPGLKATWTSVMAPPQRLQVSTSILNVRLSSAAQVNLFFPPFFRLPGPWLGGAGGVAWLSLAWGKSGKTLLCGDRDARTP
jgi:hypothetical protein